MTGTFGVIHKAAAEKSKISDVSRIHLDFFLGLKIPNFLKEVNIVVHYCITLYVHIYE